MVVALISTETAIKFEQINGRADNGGKSLPREKFAR